MTTEQARFVKKLLKVKFPWLGTDQEVNGGDVIDDLNAFYVAVKKRAAREDEDLSPEDT